MDVVTVLLAVTVAVLVALLRGGRLAALGRVRLRDRWLVVAAAAVQVGAALAVPVLGGAGVLAYRIGLGVSALAALVFCLRNVRLPGVALVAVGLLANAVVVAANGAMPVSRWAAERAGAHPSVAERRDDLRHEPADSATRLRPLGDVVPVALPGRPEVVSPGDVLVAAGLVQLVVTVAGRGARGRRERRGDPGSATPRDAARTGASGRLPG